MQNLMPPINTPDNLFHDGNPTTGVEGTIVTATYLNNDQSATRDIQQELINVLAAAAMTPDPSKQNQLIDAINSILSTTVGDIGTAAKCDVQTAKDDLTAGRVTLAGYDHFVRQLYLDMGDGNPVNGVKVGIVNDTDPETGNPIPNFKFYAHTDTADDQEVREQGKRVYSPNNEPAYPVKSVNGKDGDVVLSAADVHALPDTYTPPAPDLSAYITTSAADAKFMQGVQLGAAVAMSKVNEYGCGPAPAGCMITEVKGDPGDEFGVYTSYKPIQKNINGVWATISG